MLLLRKSRDLAREFSAALILKNRFFLSLSLLPWVSGSSISSANTFRKVGDTREREYKQLSNGTNGAAVKVETF